MESRTQPTTIVNDDLVRDLYFFFRACVPALRCRMDSRPGVRNRSGPGAVADRFPTHFGRVAQAAGWGSVEGNVLCSGCLQGQGATEERRAARGRVSIFLYATLGNGGG